MRSIIYLLMCLLVSTGCGKTCSVPDNEKADINILVIGNSLTNEAFSYFPFIMKSILPDVSVKVYTLYKSGCKTSEHYSNILSGEKEYKLNRYDWRKESWSTVPFYSSKEVLEMGNWDVIVTNSFSRRASYYDDLQPYLDNLITELHRITTVDTPVFWLQSPSLANCYESQEGNLSSNDYFEVEKEVCKRIKSETKIVDIIPCGTAIQNARNTYLNTLGDCGELTYDKLHLQEGIPKLLDAYVVSQFFLNWYYSGKTIAHSHFIPNQAFLNLGVSLGKKGSPVGVTEDNIELCKNIALDSIVHPFELTFKL